MTKIISNTKRLVSLDVFRGIAIASMILVNNPGSWKYIYPPLEHAAWHGCTPTDLVFPFFLFIVGVAMAFSFAKYTPDNRPDNTVYWRILRRGLLLFGFGLLLAIFSPFLDLILKGVPIDFSKLRIMGVLQRISLAYMLASLAVLNLKRRPSGSQSPTEGNPPSVLTHQLWILAVILLIGYWAAMQLIPVPGYGAGNLTPEGNLGGYIDRLILGANHLLKGGPFDPEGLFSTLPAVVTVLFGYFTGAWLRIQHVKSSTSINLAISGLICVIIGHFWGLIFPINKQLWTSSYVVYTAGWALLLLALCYELIEVRGLKRLGFPLEVMGLNAIFLFVGSGLSARVLNKTQIGVGEKAPTTSTWIYENLFVSWAGRMNGSLFFAVAMVLFWWIILYAMYRRRWFLKI